LNVAGYYNALFSLTEHAAAEGFLRPSHKDLVIVADNPQQLLLQLSAAPIPTEVKWVTKGER
jgi:predicted Rossmann-fold nucleotide-binding protein